MAAGDKWEYQQAEIGPGPKAPPGLTALEALVPALNKAGQDRWQFCAIVGETDSGNFLVLLKREVLLIQVVQ